MKAFIILASLLSTTVIAWQVYKPKQYTQDTIAVAMLVDKTDSLLVTPTGSDVTRLTGIDKYKYRGVHLTVEQITGYEFNPVYTAALEPGELLLSNPDERNISIDSFTVQAGRIIDTVAAAPTGRATSSIYSVVIRAINALAEAKVDKKEVAVYSDLAENVPGNFSIYNNKDREFLFEHPEQVQVKLVHRLHPVNLHNVIVHFVYTARNNVENENFVRMSAIFKSIIEGAGGRVVIEATLTSETD